MEQEEPEKDKTSSGSLEHKITGSQRPKKKRGQNKRMLDDPVKGRLKKSKLQKNQSTAVATSDVTDSNLLPQVNPIRTRKKPNKKAPLTDNTCDIGDNVLVSKRQLGKLVRLRHEIDTLHGCEFTYPEFIQSFLQQVGVTADNVSQSQGSTAAFAELYHGVTDKDDLTNVSLPCRTNAMQAFQLVTKSKFIVPNSIYNWLKKFLGNNLFLMEAVRIEDNKSTMTTLGKSIHIRKNMIKVDFLMRQYLRFQPIRSLAGQNKVYKVLAEKHKRKQRCQAKLPRLREHGPHELMANELTDGLYILGQFTEHGRIPLMIKCDETNVTFPKEINILECRSSMWNSGVYASGVCSDKCTHDCKRHPIKLSCVREHMGKKGAPPQLEVENVAPNVISVPVITNRFKWSKSINKYSVFDNDPRVVESSVVRLVIPNVVGEVAAPTARGWSLFKLKEEPDDI